MYVIGLTGQIASGKTTLANFLKVKGAIVISADSIGHAVLERPEIKEAVVKAFGADVLDNDEVDRPKLAEKVFSSKEELERLNRIMWPPIVETIKEELKVFARTLPATEIVVIDAPLLLEAGLDQCTGLVVIVSATYEKQLERLMAKGYSEDQAKARMEMRPINEEMLKKSDYTISNNANLETLEQKAEELWHFIKAQNAL